jgi:KUP system potassium uptake protein
LPALPHHEERGKVIVTVVTEDTPRVAHSERISVTKLSDSFTVVIMRFGYMESANVPAGLAACRRHGVTFDVMSTSFFLSRRALRPSAQSRMPRWQDRLFILLARSSDDASRYFHIPSGRAVEIGTQVVI